MIYEPALIDDGIRFNRMVGQFYFALEVASREVIQLVEDYFSGRDSQESES